MCSDDGEVKAYLPAGEELTRFGLGLANPNPNPHPHPHPSPHPHPDPSPHPTPPQVYQQHIYNIWQVYQQHMRRTILAQHATGKESVVSSE